MRPAILEQVEELGHVVFTQGPYNLNLIAVRSPNTEAGLYDDRLHLVFRDGFNRWQDLSLACTTDPGAYWLRHPGRVQGTAILKAGQYRGAYRVGLHRRRYPALVQARPVTVWRDNSRDTTLDHRPGSEQSGLFGINIHHGGTKDPDGIGDDVGRWSAGCTVIGDLDDWTIFWSIVSRSAELYGDRFTYTLIEE